MRLILPRPAMAIVAALLLLPHAWAAEHVSLANGFDLVCDHRISDGNKTRLYLTSSSDSSFVEVATADIVTIETVAAVPMQEEQAATNVLPQHSNLTQHSNPTQAELHELLASAGSARNLDVDLLACVVHAESGGRVHVVSHAGAQGLMQLMPKTAAQLGVTDSFEPSQNIEGGTAYLDALLSRYHDNLALALAAYNAGPEAVDRYHGVPPYRETRAYVARIIHEFNQRKRAAEARSMQAEHAANHAPTGLEIHAMRTE